MPPFFFKPFSKTNMSKANKNHWKGFTLKCFNWLVAGVLQKHQNYFKLSLIVRPFFHDTLSSSSFPHCAPTVSTRESTRPKCSVSSPAQSCPRCPWLSQRQVAPRTETLLLVLLLDSQVRCKLLGAESKNCFFGKTLSLGRIVLSTIKSQKYRRRKSSHNKLFETVDTGCWKYELQS